MPCFLISGVLSDSLQVTKFDTISKNKFELRNKNDEKKENI